MPLPGVKIDYLNGQLGRVEPSEDAVMALVLSGVATSEIPLSTPKQIFDTEGANDLLLNDAYDTTNSTDVYKQIKDYYETAGSGAELWVMIVAKTTTMSSACDKANDIVKKLFSATSGRVTMWGITRVPDGGYTAAYTTGLDDDVKAAVLKAQDLCDEFAVDNQPCRFLVGGRDFQGDAGDLESVRTWQSNRGQVVFYSTTSAGHPAVGHLLGQYANRPVQRNPGRVKDGFISGTQLYFTDGSPVEDYKSAWDSIHDKGFVFARTFVKKSGYYISDDPTCTLISDDYSSMARGRVIDKAARIAYANYVEEVLDDLEVDEDGFLPPSVVKGFQGGIEKAISDQMLNIDIPEISGVRCEVDPRQNLLSNDKVKIKKLAVRPKGYAKYIDVSLGFDNPANT